MLSVHSTYEGFGNQVRLLRDELAKDSKEFSVRKVAAKIGVEPYLSKVDEKSFAYSETKIIALAKVLELTKTSCWRLPVNFIGFAQDNVGQSFLLS